MIASVVKQSSTLLQFLFSETLKKVSESLQKAQKRLSKPFGKKPTPGTPDSAIAECLEEDHVSAKADDKKDTSTTPNVTEAIKEKKTSGLGEDD